MGNGVNAVLAILAAAAILMLAILGVVILGSSFAAPHLGIWGGVAVGAILGLSIGLLLRSGRIAVFGCLAGTTSGAAAGWVGGGIGILAGLAAGVATFVIAVFVSKRMHRRTPAR